MIHQLKGVGNLIGMGISLEILYSFIIILASLMIYFSTREFYELTKHRGIKYFRTAFLFFAVAFFLRSFIKIVFFFVGVPMAYGITFRIILHSTTLFLFTYFSAIAIFYLMYSVKYKRWKSEKLIIFLFHTFAMVLAIIPFLSTNPYILIGVNLLLLTIILIAISESKNEKRKKNSLYPIYVLLFIFWIINLLDILIPNFFKLYQILIYLSSVAIFMSILYKVLKNIG